MKTLSYVLKYFSGDRFDTEPALRRFHMRTGQHVNWWRYAVSAAAAIALVAMLSYFHYNVWTRYEAFDTAQSFTLKDGSRVLLSPGSSLRLQPNKNPRAVTMAGRILFDVARNENRPFEVFSDSAYIKVLGTVFSLDSKATTVSVVSGKVFFAGCKSAGGIILSAGESARMHDGKPATLKVLNPLAWASGKFVYKDAELEAVLDELSRYYGHTIVPLRDVRGKTITGSFDASDEQAILSAIEAATGIQLEAEL